MTLFINVALGPENDDAPEWVLQNSAAVLRMEIADHYSLDPDATSTLVLLCAKAPAPKLHIALLTSTDVGFVDNNFEPDQEDTPVVLAPPTTSKRRALSQNWFGSDRGLNSANAINNAAVVSYIRRLEGDGIGAFTLTFPRVVLKNSKQNDDIVAMHFTTIGFSAMFDQFSDLCFKK